MRLPRWMKAIGQYYREAVGGDEPEPRDMHDLVESGDWQRAELSGKVRELLSDGRARPPAVIAENLEVDPVDLAPVLGAMAEYGEIVPYGETGTWRLGDADEIRDARQEDGP